MSNATVLSTVPSPTDVIVATLVAPPQPETVVPSTPWWRRVLRQLGQASEWLFGLFSLIVGLSILATIPVVQFLSLGYLLESSGRLVRSGRLRDGFVGVRTAARIGSAALGTWVTLLPARLVSSLWYSSLLINGPDAKTARWRVALIVITSLTIIHILWAWLRGGRFRHFLWPAPRRLWQRLRRGGLYEEARDGLWSFVLSLRLPYYFQLGLRGGLGAIIWLALPVTLLVMASRVAVPLGVLSGLIGATLLAIVLVHLPFLQTHFAAENSWRELFAWRRVRALFRRAPIAFWIALLATLALALPLYLLKAELVPREAAWLPSLVFVLFIWPARLITGWAVGRAERRETSRHWFFRWLSRLSFVPVALLYVLVVYFTQYTSWHGGLSLYEQHAFLLPVPFLGM